MNRNKTFCKGMMYACLGIIFLILINGFILGANTFVANQNNVINGTTVIAPDGNARVGIGLISPGAKLMINVSGDSPSNNGGWDSRMFVVSSGGASSGGASSGLGIGLNATAGFAWIDAAKPQVSSLTLSINPGGGNVGIGTTNPGSTLDVNGVLTLNRGTTGGYMIVNSPGGVTSDYIGTIRGWVSGSNTDNGIAIANYNNSDSIQFFNNSTNPTMILKNGNVGIGTAPNVSNKLEVNGTLHVGNAWPSKSLDMFYDSGNDRVTVQASGTGNPNLYLYGYNVYIDNQGDTIMTDGVRITGMQNNGSAYPHIVRDGATGLLMVETSSIKYKQNVRNLTYGLSDIMKLTPRLFEWQRDNKTGIGFIAEEMISIIPEVVFLDNNSEPIGIDYEKLTAVLSKGMQEQQQQIQNLTRENENLQAQIDAINNKLVLMGMMGK